MTDTLTIQNNVFSIAVSPLGAELKSFKILKNNTEILWPGRQLWLRTAPWLFPVVGKVFNDQYSYENKHYKMTQHGFLRDMVFELTEQSSSKLKFKFKSSELTIKQYPFNFSIEVTYELKNEDNNSFLEIIFDVISCDDNKIPFSFGWHPAFDKNCIDVEKFKKLSGHLRLLNSEGFLDAEHSLDQTDENTISELMNKDLNNAVFLEKNTHSKIELFKDFYLEFHPISDLVGFWSKNSNMFLCVEPWWGTASINDPFKYSIDQFKAQQFIFKLGYSKKSELA